MSTAPHDLDPTLSEQSGDPLLAERAPRLPALVLLWLAGEPARAGELCLLPTGEPWGPPRILGRGEPRADDPERRVQLVRHVAAAPEPAGAIVNPHISRVQLELKGQSSGRIAARNLGRCRAYKNGEPFDTAELEPGDVLRLGQQMLFLCTLRPAWARPLRAPRAFDFGRADAHGIVGESPGAWKLRHDIAAAAAEEGHVLLLGETGTGKELVARALHAESARGSRPLVARNAATLPEGLIDAELFGSAKNYPNAGMPERPGLFGQAHGSTLFLDEFGELGQALQVHLLRVLDDGEYQRLGEATPRRSSFRLIAATNRSPDVLRDDVLARFKLRISLPPLAEHREDIPLLARHLLALRSRGAEPDALPPRLIERLVAHDFTGNVRELDALLLRHSRDPDYESWSDVWSGPGSPDAAPAPRDPMMLDRERIARCLEEHGWVQEKAWRALGLSSRHALARLMKKYGIDEPPR